MCDPVSATIAVVGAAGMGASAIQQRNTRHSAERKEEHALEKAENERLSTLASNQAASDMAMKRRKQALLTIEKQNATYTDNSLLGRPLSTSTQTKSLLGS